LFKKFTARQWRATGQMNIAHIDGNNAYGSLDVDNLAVLSGAADEMQMQAFLHQWGLGENAGVKLRELPAHIQNVVMAEFSPRDTKGRPPDSLFIMFAASVQKRLQAGMSKDQFKVVSGFTGPATKRGMDFIEQQGPNKIANTGSGSAIMAGLSLMGIQTGISDPGGTGMGGHGSSASTRGGNLIMGALRKMSEGMGSADLEGSTQIGGGSRPGRMNAEGSNPNPIDNQWI